MGLLQGTEEFLALAPFEFVAHSFGDEAATVSLDAVDACH
jgi:hypothetical protein